MFAGMSNRTGESMSQVVSYERRGEIGIITVDHPPVNALSAAVRQGLIDRLDEGLADPEAKALVLVGAGRTFIAGADIREFGKPPLPPGLNEVIARYEDAGKPVVAALHGSALGGGLEVALGCHYRVAVPGSRVGLPEVKLGLLPGAGGTQRLPRLVGARKAMELITSGEHVPADRAAELGIVDELASTNDPVEAGVSHARRVIAENLPLRRVRDRDDRIAADRGNGALFEEFRAGLRRSARGLLSPFKIVDAVEDAVNLPFDEGLASEREMFAECMNSPQRAGLIHAFFAEREAQKVPGMPEGVKPREIRSVGIIGAGTMGGGIAMNFANVGIPVHLKEVEQEALDRGIGVVRRNYENSAKRGRITRAQVEERMDLIHGTLDYDDFRDVDLVIEAVFENMDLKKRIFTTLDELCKPGCVLATNTSTLSIDEIASVTSRPEDVVGMHFFSPANVMKLLENVRGEKTSWEVIATVMNVGKRIQKVPVLVGTCYGFVGNRMLHQRGAEAMALVNEGASPAEVDRVLTDLGFPMGQFAMSDLAGIDVGYLIRQELRKAGEEVPPAWMDGLHEAGRLGQKTGAGVYRYERGSRTPLPDPETDRIIEEFRRDQGIVSREIDSQEMLERQMYVMINEAAKILEEGIAVRSSDIDVVWIYGYGFPAYRGGPMFWADQVGLDTILAAIENYRRTVGGERWEPAPLLERLVREGKRFSDR
jgi:3-hydroxyacyl-CoA dehydrogenase